jgi:predicted dithiol-disulfide oxidoreductase (DUF899 family)
MALPEVVSREQWLAARLRLLAQKKELTRRRDALNAERRRLPMVRVGTMYLFDGPHGLVSLGESRPQLEYNYRPEPGLLGGGRSAEMPGMSCFLRDGGEVYHTYSAYARGLDHLEYPYAFLDLTAFGRQEDWEEPKGRAPVTH